MSLFEDDYSASGVSDLLTVLGVVAVYKDHPTRPQADAVTLTAAVDIEQSRIDVDAQDRKTVRRTKTAIISTDIASSFGGVAAPKQSGVLVINNVTWSIESVTRTGGGMARLALVRTEVLERARTGYRAGR